MGRVRKGNDNVTPPLPSGEAAPPKRKRASKKKEKEVTVTGEVEPETTAVTSTRKKVSKGKEHNGNGAKKNKPIENAVADTDMEPEIAEPTASRKKRTCKRVDKAIVQSMRGSGTEDQDEIAYYEKVELELNGDIVPYTAFIDKLKTSRSLSVVYTLEHWEYLVDNEDGEEEIWREAMGSFKAFNDNIIALLEKSGKDILRFQFSCWKLDDLIENLQMSISQIYLILRDFLSLMPNMKWLVLQLDHCSRRFNSIWGTLSKMEDVDESVLLGQPMPRITRLERVDFKERAGHYNVLTICNAVLLSNPHIKYHFHDTENYLQHHLTSPPVLALALQEAKIANEWFDKVDIPFLQKISNSYCNWNLKKLTLWTNAKEGSIQDIFLFLGRFPKLETLELHVDNAVVQENAMFPPLENLTVLKMEIGPDIKFQGKGTMLSLFSLKFLHHCRALKQLKWKNLIHFGEAQKIKQELEGVGVGGGEIMTDFRGGFEDLSASNIWNVFQELEEVDVAFLMKKEDPVDGRKLTRMKYLKRELISSKMEWMEGRK